MVKKSKHVKTVTSAPSGADTGKGKKGSAPKSSDAKGSSGRGVRSRADAPKGGTAPPAGPHTPHDVPWDKMKDRFWVVSCVSLLLTVYVSYFSRFL